MIDDWEIVCDLEIVGPWEVDHACVPSGCFGAARPFAVDVFRLGAMLEHIAPRANRAHPHVTALEAAMAHANRVEIGANVRHNPTTSQLTERA